MWFILLNVLIIGLFCSYFSINEFIGFDIEKFIVMVARHVVVFTVAALSGAFDMSYDLNLITVAAYVFTWFSILNNNKIFDKYRAMDDENLEFMVILMLSHFIMFNAGSLSIMEGALIAILCGAKLIEIVELLQLKNLNEEILMLQAKNIIMEKQKEAEKQRSTEQNILDSKNDILDTISNGTATKKYSDDTTYLSDIDRLTNFKNKVEPMSDETYIDKPELE